MIPHLLKKLTTKTGAAPGTLVHIGEKKVEQVSLLLTKDTLISFQESEGDVFEPVRQRLRLNRGRIRKAGSDYLAYALVDAVVDHYFIVLERIGSDIERIEEIILAMPEHEALQDLYGLKREIVYFKHKKWF